MRSGSAFVRLALGFARVDCAEWCRGGLLPDAGRRTQDAGRRTPDAGRRALGAGRRTQGAGRRA